MFHDIYTRRFRILLTISAQQDTTYVDKVREEVNAQWLSPMTLVNLQSLHT